MRAPLRSYRPPMLPPNQLQRRDPRQFGQGYDPYAVDLLHGEAVQAAIAAGGVVPMAIVQELLTAHNLPPQLVQGSFLKWITATGRAGAQLLIPKNPNRQGFIVSNYTGAPGVLFSFDAPLDTMTGAAGAAVLAGIPVGGCYQEANGSVSVNDIFVFCNDSTADFPFPILCYESNLSIEGNKP